MTHRSDSSRTSCTKWSKAFLAVFLVVSPTYRMSTELNRCPRCLSHPTYIDYHDKERWVPIHDDRKQFEYLCLEGAQAGLSWLTVLKKRDAYREAFAQFDPHQVARYDEAKLEELMQNAWLIRNKLKLQSTINNARRFLEIQQERWTFSTYLRHFTDGKSINNKLQSSSDYQAHSLLSDTISKDLIKKGFKFVWTTIIYAHLQAVGVINDHLMTCFRHNEVG